MHYEMRVCLASEFAKHLKALREDRWEVFKEAAVATNQDPYVALARILTLIAEEVIDSQPRATEGPEGH